MSQYVILLCDLDMPNDRIVSNHDTKDAARARCRKLNAQIIAERGMPERGKPPVPLYYVLKVGNWNGGMYRRFLGEKRKGICVVCDGEFERFGNSRTCSEKCSKRLSDRRRRKRMELGEIPGRYAL